MTDTGHVLFVDPRGDDNNPGTQNQPLASLAQTQETVRAVLAQGHGPVTVYLPRGNLLPGCAAGVRPRRLGRPRTSGPIWPPIWRARHAEWRRPTLLLLGTLRDGIWRAELHGAQGHTRSFDQLFVNGKRQTRAAIQMLIRQTPHTIPDTHSQPARRRTTFPTLVRDPTTT